jgi:hypothetical protein
VLEKYISDFKKPLNWGWFWHDANEEGIKRKIYRFNYITILNAYK